MECTGNACATKIILAVTVVFPKPHSNSELSLSAAINTEFLRVACCWLYFSYFLENLSTVINISSKIRRTFVILIIFILNLSVIFLFLNVISVSLT